MAALAVETIRQRISDWLQAMQRDPNPHVSIPPVPERRLLQGADQWHPSEGHLCKIQDGKQYGALARKWGLRPYYYEGPGAYELQRVQGICGCNYAALRRVAMVKNVDLQTIGAEDCQEPAWGPDIREAGRWQAPRHLYTETDVETRQ